MSLPPCFASPEPNLAALPLVLVDRAGYGAWRDRQSAAVQAWLAAHDFSGQSGAPLLVPGADGQPAYSLAGISDPGDPLALAHLPSMLPPGNYRLSPDSPLALDPGQALLGWGLGAYRFDRYLKPGRAPARLVLEDAGTDNSEAFALLKAATLVRDLVNTPTEHMGPAELEAVAARLAQAYGGQLNVVAGEDLLKQNFPAIHAVGRASHRAPRLIELTWGDEAHPRLAIVGKGVCFDTGGLDIKAADGMRNMKKDMGGSAHALGLAQLVMARRLPVRLQLLVPAVENSIGPNAFRPGEVLATRLGLSVEVDNTDAEGRLVLCDALAYAAEAKPALLMDFATLTGAARIAWARTCRRCSPTTTAWPRITSPPANARAIRCGACRCGVRMPATSSPASPTSPTPARRAWRAASPPPCTSNVLCPKASAGRTWTCTPGTTATAPANPPAAKRRACAPPGAC